mgnify:FL=1
MSDLLDEIYRLSSITRVVTVAIGLPIFICGIVGNLINILGFTYLPQFNKLPSSIFLLFSFLASETALLVILLPQLVFRLSGTDPLVNNLILCKLRWFIGPLSATVALHCICLASINQYLITSRIIRRHQWITRRRAIFISSFVVLFWIGPLSPSIVYHAHTYINLANVTICTAINPTFTLYYTYISIIIYSLIPILVLFLFSFLTWYNIRKQLIRHFEIEQTLTRMLSAQIIMVLLTTLPNFCSQLYFFYTRTTMKSSLRLALENLMATILTLISSGIHSFSFYTYILTSKAFRQNILSLFQLNQHRIQPNSILMRERT